MARRRGDIGFRPRDPSPYAMGWVALALEALVIFVIAAATLFTMWGFFGEWFAARLPFLPPAAWSATIAVILLRFLMPRIHPLARRLSCCPACDKPTLLTSPDLDEWNLRANPGGHVAGQRRFRPEEQCSQCHADLRKAG